jgi:hypothetical protein
MAAAALVGAALVLPQGGESAVAQTPAASTQSIKVGIRRVTESQYRHAIADVFGPQVRINARFEPEKREEGLLAVGVNQLSVTTSGLEQYYALATSISDQVLDEARRQATTGCTPADATKSDAACARTFITTVGAKLFRRPLTEPEIASRVATAARGADQAHDFYRGLKLSLTSLLIDPDFLFRMEVAESVPGQAGQYRLNGYTKASRLSYLFWDAPPDAELIAAARTGAIHTPQGLQAQITRLSASPRLKDGAGAFFVDMLQFDAFDGLSKDAATYPKFSQAVADSAREQTLRTVIDQLVVRKRDYRELFTSNDTFINRPLAAVYRVPYASAEEWTPYTFPQTSERSGILTQVTFLALFAHPGRSSPTRRGVKLNEIFACQPTPDPPADVDFSRVQATENGTVRSRLLDHMVNPGCSVCHRNSDPIGLTLEHFDGLGQLRTTENNQPIDVTGEIAGVRFTGAQGLGQYMHDNPRVPACLVRNVYAYGVGRAPGIRDEDYLTSQTAAFANAGYRVPDLFKSIASSPEFFAVVRPAGLAAAPPRPAPTSAPRTNPPGGTP